MFVPNYGFSQLTTWACADIEIALPCDFTRISGVIMCAFVHTFYTSLLNWFKLLCFWY